MQIKNELNLNKKIKFSYNNIFQGVIEVYKNEGILNGLFRGASARVAFSAPSSALSIAFFEIIKMKINQNQLF